MHLKLGGEHDAGCQRRDLLRGGVDGLDPAFAEVEEEVVVAVGGGEGGGVVEIAAGNGTAGDGAGVVLVGVEGGGVGGVVGGAFGGGPAEVGGGGALVDLFPGRFADVVDEHASSAGLEGEGEGVAEAFGPDRA